MAAEAVALEREDVRSYRKTIVVVLGLLVLVSIGGYVAVAALSASSAPRPLVTAAGVFVVAAAIALALAALAGTVVVRRARRADGVDDDLFVALNSQRSEAAFHDGAVRIPFRSLRRMLGAQPLLVGDAVKIKPFSEIAATLDASGCLDGMPFMIEMQRFCGKSARVYRVVDKVYDYGGRKDLRRLHDTVLLHDLRCDGAAHGGCQAECYLLWKTAWLDAAGDDEAPVRSVPAPAPAVSAAVDVPDAVYRCQYTQIVASSQPMSARGVRQYVRPLLAGNVTLAAFSTTIATLLFNRVQQLRGGTGFPRLEPKGKSAPAPDLGLKPGELVRVKTGDEIAATLDKRGKNKGLWFDRDMLKHAGKVYTVRARVNRIIDDVTGKMLYMRSPCILLDGVDGSGEYIRLAAQHDYVFWREAWLARVDRPQEPQR